MKKAVREGELEEGGDLERRESKRMRVEGRRAKGGKPEQRKRRLKRVGVYIRASI